MPDYLPGAGASTFSVVGWDLAADLVGGYAAHESGLWGVYEYDLATLTEALPFRLAQRLVLKVRCFRDLAEALA